MRAPVEFDPYKDYGAYSTADWRKIEKSLAGIDLDATTFSRYPYLAPEHPEQDKAPLREALQNLANYYAALARLKPGVTTSELVAWLRQAEAAFEAAREQLHWVSPFEAGDDMSQRRHAATTYNVADAALQDAIALVRRRLGKLVARSGSSKNAEKLHRKFWTELLLLWRSLPIAPKQRTHADLRAFLHACSAPIFPAETKPGALMSFTKNTPDYKSRQFPKRAC
jgi:hypothetical protein